MRVLSIGECMAELAPTKSDGDFKLGFAGDTFNTVWYLAQCAPKVQALYLTAVGNDAISQDMRVFMRKSHIDDRFVQTAKDKTLGLYLISLKNGERSFSYWRDQSAARCLADDIEFLTNAMASADLIYFSGITLAILPADKRVNFYESLRIARNSGKMIAFDPNLRPNLWATTEEMKHEIMLGASVSDLVLPSFEDELDWFQDADPQVTIQRYADAGAHSVVVKNGANAVFYLDNGVLGSVPVVAVETLVDTTAAGDSFNGGLFAGLSSDHSLKQSIRYACDISRNVVQHRGALTPLTAFG